MIKKWFNGLGPGTLVAAAFIGPGTVTVCTLAGLQFGFTLLWAMVLSVITTIILQEMSARLGIVTRQGFAEVIRATITNKQLKWLVVILILTAIVVGNAAYEAGNISGAVLGLETALKKPVVGFFGFSINIFSLLIGLIAVLLLYIGNYKILERVLISLVILMSISFLITAFMTKPAIFEVLKGMFLPRIPDKSLLLIIGLIGTTVVPYNLFLHAALVKEKWQTNELDKARKDTVISMLLGGIVSMAIIVSAAAIKDGNSSGVTALAEGLEPLYGDYARYFLAIGLFAAGITSAITAPLAAAYVASGCLNWSGGMRSKRFRLVWFIIVLLGVVFSSLGFKPIEVIKFAQVANGILLPVIAGLLLWIMNNGKLLVANVNTLKQNILGLIVVLITVFLGLKGILQVFNLLS